jgi:hypothetical protein
VGVRSAAMADAQDPIAAAYAAALAEEHL